ncbi:2-isopropylmalate synthase [Acinetobacter puyangensis]|uniref:2-isopropylmalate synthase n=1 Tax=Acinetobacter puyangensis TaxID=1096779 RepID=A0A240E7U4_9GAMM|nr:2-isopropylmalate synthase [Acinetobacter puyangensis]SNX43965.1 2-isopropylmalate synthase [Acinetobacter puyangensis]
MSSNQLIIFDTTLRDGEQSPGAAMTKEEKIRVARQLERLGVDVIEAGFAAASPGDFDAISSIANIIKDSTICSLARANEKDIARAGEAIRHANRGRVHTFIATSPIHMQHKLRMSEDQVVEQAVKAIGWARQYTDDVEFSAEDAARSDMDFLVRIFDAVIQAGVKTINVPDTVGYMIPELWGARFKALLERVPNSDKVIWSTHCHNDLGMAVANSLAAVQNGARQVECTINGLGERAGNASLEEIVMATRVRKDLFDVTTNIRSEEIVPTSRLVSTITGYVVQPNKAIVGANAFAHESGIHQDGVLKHRETYEIMRAEDVGWKTNKLTLGKLSGRAAFRARLDEIGIAIESDEHLNELFRRFKDLADRKAEIFDEDLHALASGQDTLTAKYQLKELEVTSKTGQTPRAHLLLTVDGKDAAAAESGSGPVDAVFKAIEVIAKSKATLELYQVNAITSGTDSQGEVLVRLNKDGRIVTGQGADTDIVIASAKAYLSALNWLGTQAKTNPQKDEATAI